MDRDRIKFKGFFPKIEEDKNILVFRLAKSFKNLYPLLSVIISTSNFLSKKY